MAIQINGKKVIHLGSMTIPVLKGEKGDQGVRGQQGIPGIDGKDGQTPLRGIDYWTTEDKTEIINEIDNKVQEDLKSYYLKSETYNKEEIDNKISLIPKFNTKVVDKLPTSNISEATVYLVKSGEESQNLYTEYIYTNGVWEQLGTQKLDLSGFYNKDEINSMLATRDSKITALEEENRSQADRIKELEEEVEILSGDYKEKEIQGETVAISDGLAKSKVPVKVNGNSHQETTEGYQLLDVNNNIRSLYYLTYKDNIFTSDVYTGDAVRNHEIRLKNPIKILSGQTLYLKFKAKIKSGTGTFSNNLNDGKYSFTNVSNPILSTSYQEYITKKTYTEDTDVTTLLFQVKAGASELVFEMTDLMLSTDDKPYEPFTNGVATPNINHKQDIEVIDTVNELNLEDKTISAYDINAVIKKGEITINGTPSGINFNQNIITFVAPKTETYSLHSFKSAVNNNIRFIYKINGAAWVNADRFPEIALNKGDTVTVYLRIDSTNAISNFTIAPMLYEGTYDENKVFLPYGCIGLVQRGKNYFDINAITSIADGSINENIITSSSLTGWGLTRITFSPIPLKANVTYYISMLIKKDSGAYSLPINTVQVNTSKGILNTVAIAKPKLTSEYQKSVFSYTPTANITLNGLFVQRNGGDSNSLVFSIKDITVSDIDDTYEPYIEPKIIPIDLAGNSLAKVESGKDLLKIGVNGSVKANKVIKEYVFTGDEWFSVITNANGLKYFSNTAIITDYSNENRYTHCNYFKNILDMWNVSVLTDCQALAQDSKSMNIMCKDMQDTDATRFKAWLKEKYNAGTPLKIMYATTNPTTIDLPSIEPITLFEGTNVFELVTNLGTTLVVTYKVSNKKKILNLEERISALESAVIGG